MEVDPSYFADRNEEEFFYDQPTYKELINNPKFKKLKKLSPKQRKKFGFQGESYTMYARKFLSVYFMNKTDKHGRGIVFFGPHCEGPNGCVHGGCIATVVDECFGWVAAEGADLSVTASLTIKYKKFVPINSLKIVEGRIDRTEGDRIILKGRIYDPVDNTTHVEGEAVFVKFNWRKFNENLSTPALTPQLDIGSQEDLPDIIDARTDQQPRTPTKSKL